MKKLSILVLTAIAALTVSLSSCTKYSDAKKNSISTTTGTSKLVCDKAFENIIRLEIDVYEFRYPYTAVLDTCMPENDAIMAFLKNPSFSSLVSTRELTKAEISVLANSNRTARSMPIAVDAIALITNPQNPTDSISVDQLRDIFTGKITRWNQIDPNNNLGEIQIVFDNSSSSTVNLMRNEVLSGNDFTSPNIYAQGNERRVFQFVNESKSAIGLMGVGWLSYNLAHRFITETEVQEIAKAEGDNADLDAIRNADPVKVLAVSNPTEANNFSTKAYKPYQKYIYGDAESGTRLYPFVRMVYMTTTASPHSPGSGFYSFVTGKDGQKEILKTGVLPARMEELGVQLTN